MPRRRVFREILESFDSWRRDVWDMHVCVSSTSFLNVESAGREDIVLRIKGVVVRKTMMRMLLDLSGWSRVNQCRARNKNQ